jgi:AhpD family alkylhydroperoxidase
MMRIQPIESTNPVLRLVSWMMRRQFGRSITPVNVIFTRLPRALLAQLGIYAGLGTGKSLPIDPELQLLLQHRTAEINGCSFCVDIGRAMATYRDLSLEKIDGTAEWRTSPLFSARERAALAYVEEVTRNRRVSDETFAALRAHFDDRQIVAITWLNAVENYFNLLNGPLEIESDGLCAIAERRTGKAAARVPTEPAARVAARS